jgi:hypothetical protein
MPIADFPALAPLFQGPAAIFTPALPGAAQAYLAWSLMARHGRPCCGSPTARARWIGSTKTWPPWRATARTCSISIPPANRGDRAPRRRHSQPRRHRRPPADAPARARSTASPGIIATCIHGAAGVRPPPDRLRGQVRALHLNANWTCMRSPRNGARRGYRFGRWCWKKGGGPARGAGHLAATEPWPLRLEFFGSTLDSIRAFDPVAQRSRERGTPR